MGMFDDIEFREGNTKLPPDMTPKLQKEGWQTKELYDQMYQFVFVHDLMFYKEGDGSLHLMPLTGTFEIHTWIPEESKMYDYQVEVKEGHLIAVGPKTDPRYQGLPHIDAMTRDAERSAEGWENTVTWLTKVEESRSWFDKLRSNVRSCKREWAEALQFFVKGIKRLFGYTGW